MALHEHRRLSGRGNLHDARRLWRVTERAFAEWRGLELTDGEGLAVAVAPLRSSELAELIEFAHEQPGAVRDLLKMRVEARRQGKRVVTRHQPWPRERQAMLVELHLLALAAARRELQRARQAYAACQYRDRERGNYTARMVQRNRMVKNCLGRVEALQAAAAVLAAEVG